LDPRAARASVNGEPLRLTSLEYRLLHYMMMHQGRVISRTELVEHLYDQDFDRDSNTIEVFIGRVRKKEQVAASRSSGPAGSGPDWGRFVGRPGRSLTRRLIWLASGWILFALVISALVLTQAFQESALRRLGATLNETIDEIVVAASRTPQGETVPQIQDARTLRLLSGKYWQIIEVYPDGRHVSVARSTSLWTYDLNLPLDLPQRLDASFGDVISFNTTGPKDEPTSREPLRVAASMKSIPRHDHPVIFLAAIDRSDVDADTRQFGAVTWIALFVLGLGLVAAAFIQVRIGLRPLFDLRNEIAAVRKGPSGRIERSYPLEIQPLAEQVNRLLDHNQEVVDRQRTHVGNLAHALKTPISVMLAEAGDQQGALPELVRRQTKVMQGQ
ncbi:hypothetical protein LTR94_027028, partial [Friedmanniomyces endolithicus]